MQIKCRKHNFILAVWKQTEEGDHTVHGALKEFGFSDLGQHRSFITAGLSAFLPGLRLNNNLH